MCPHDMSQNKSSARQQSGPESRTAKPASEGAHRSGARGGDVSAQKRRLVPPPDRESPGGVQIPSAYPMVSSETEAKSQDSSEQDVTSKERYSTGFILGIALLVVSLLGGLCIVGLYKKANSLEKRLSALEKAEPPRPWMP